MNKNFNEDSVLQFLQDLKHLVNIDSTTYNIDAIKKILDFFIARASKMKLHSILKTYDDKFAPLLIITNTSGLEDLDIVFIAHADTTRENNEEHTPFSTNKNYAYGNGIIDNKSGALLAMNILEYLPDLEKFNFAFIINSNEEEGSIKSQEIIQNVCEKSKYSLVLEPAREDGSLVNKRYGVANYKISFQGEKNFIFNFDKEASALVESAKFITELNKLNIDENSIINFTIIDSKDKHSSIVPYEVILGLQIRYLNSEVFNIFKNKMEKIVNNKISKKIKVDIEKIVNYPELYNNFEARLLKRYIDEIINIQGIDASWQVSFGGSDGCFASKAGSATIDGLGLVGGNMHKKDEYLLIPSIKERFNLLMAIVDKIIKIKEINSNGKEK